MQISEQTLREAWATMAHRVADGSGLALLEQTIVHGDLGLSAVLRVQDSMPGVAIRVPQRLGSSRWSAQRFSGVHFEQPVKTGSDTLLPILLADVECIRVYACFVRDLANIISRNTDAEARAAELAAQLSQWKKFFQTRRRPLSEEEVKGLIAELYVLEGFAMAAGPSLALESWRGPLGSLHDFQHDAFKIEVKSWTNEMSARVSISDPSQLIIDDQCPVFLAVLRLAADTSAGSALPVHIARVEHLFDAVQRVRFFELLGELGYLPSQAELYDSPYALRDTAYYRVKDGFPLIRGNDIPPGISEVRFLLALNAIESFREPQPF
jgi:hypothetical protein